MRKIILLIALLNFASPQFARAEGGAISGGGDSISAQFTAIGYDVYRRLVIDPVRGVEAKQFLTFLQRTRVITKERLRLNHAEVDAINHPQKNLIELSRMRWNSIANQPRDQFILVAHEYLSVGGLADQRYQISHELFDNPGLQLVKYDCQLYPQMDGVLNISMRSYIYKSFVHNEFYNRDDGAPVSDVSSVYSYALDKQENNTNLFKPSVLVTVSWGCIHANFILAHAGHRKASSRRGSLHQD